MDTTEKKQPRRNTRTDERFHIVGLGASAGGLEAFESFFSNMTPDAGMAFIVVPHLDPHHVSILPELIQKHTSMEVKTVTDGMRVRPGTVYVVPPNRDLSILNGKLQLLKLAEPHGLHLPIDFFFRSLAEDQGEQAICIVLSGTGSDGTLGLKAIKGEGGMAMVQDVKSAKYDGMPRNAAGTGLADYVLAPAAMGTRLLQFTKHTACRCHTGTTSDDPAAMNSLQKIYILLRAKTGHDFSLYKKNTICRRIERRMHIQQIDQLDDYVLYLRESPQELDILFKELLIGVTSFFRDPEAFEQLAEKILPELLSARPNDFTLRVWVPGCSSGEEAYSIAIILHEVREKMGKPFNIQIFGTDIDEGAVDTARSGIYPASISPDVGEERLKRYFTRRDDQFQIKKSIRELLVLAPQNVIKDPPFTKLDLLSCRNLLIYLGPELQKKLLPIFHYSLNPRGLLFLGSSETIGQSTDLFKPLNKKWKIFQRQFSRDAGRPMLEFPHPPAPEPAAEIESAISVKQAEEISALQLVESILAQSETPPCAVIDESCNILYIHGRTGRFLEPPTGRASVNIIEMARPGLKVDLASAIRKVNQSRREHVQSGIRVQNNGSHISLKLAVRPMFDQGALRTLLLVTFEEIEALPSKKASPPRHTKKNAKNVAVVRLEQELQYTRENLQTTIEELETSNEELKSTNEELQSTNEELQSTNEELETSKEELQSLNEEATTVNLELQCRIDELSAANDDIKNLLDSTEIATIFLDIDLGVRRFTPRSTELIPLTSTDTGRPINHFATNLNDVELRPLAEKVLDDLLPCEQEVGDREGHCFRMRIRPYRTMNNVIDGVVITFEDITELKTIQHEMATIHGRYTLFQEHFTGIIFYGDIDFNLTLFKGAVTKLTGYREKDFVGGELSWHDLIHPDDLIPLQPQFQQMRSKSGFSAENEYRIYCKDGTTRWVCEMVQNICDDKGIPQSIQGIIYDISDRKNSEAQLAAILHHSLSGFWKIDPGGRILEVNDAYCRMSGYSREALLTMRVSDVEAVESEEEVKEHIRRIRELGSDRFTTRHRRKDGSELELEVSVNFLDTDGGMLLTFMQETQAIKR